MKTTTNLKFIATVSIMLLLNFSVFAQNENNRPKYLSATTMHWNMEKEDFSMDAWKALEKEYLQKILSKNQYITSASYYTHLFTPDNSEVLYVQTYPSWEAMDKAAERSEELAKQAWPDEKARTAFFKKRDDYFSVNHSDEIYAPIDGAKLISQDNTKDLVLYIRKTYFTFPEDGTQKEFDEMRAENFAKVVSKNEYIKGYYPNVHAWGSDKTEFVEAFFVDSMCDMEKMFDRNGELIGQAWPGDSGERRGKKWSKYFTGVHGDSAYTLVAEISK
ncbi:hypothetical protein [Aequorivita sp. CIP111184]|uniref:hypothetical protein n=1 Tax=Aequorivita sp. CIP111184 TaxID=2211356 RepID=UPI000DBC14D4|nr:hypothetical protein [Aequorivita sp. CIP111184]SRX51966.1 hypothetical protein AEQU1_00026 [Aequorivita sp. CIP111184]